MTFAEWIDGQWRRPGETVTTALNRLSAEWGLSYKCLFYAHRGARVKPETAELIEQRTQGRVSAADLVMLPTRAELRARGEAA